jgi:N-acetyl sugar amidotransferase
MQTLEIRKDITMKRNLIEMYGLPKKVEYCRRCTISNQRPRITFDVNGVCSACNFAEYKKTKIDWGAREQELIRLCDRYRKNNGEYDVIVPCSGGKDGSYVAHQLKHKYGMNPLTVTWAPLKATEIGRRNLDSFVGSGFDHILGTANPIVARKLTKLAFEHMGDPFQPFIYGQTNFPLHVSVKYKVPLIMYGENGEVEYGGDMKNANSPTRKIQDHDKHYFSGLPPEFWRAHGLSDRDLHAFTAPKYSDVTSNNTEIHFFSYYKFWDPQENYYYCKEHTGFQPNPERSQGTYSKYASLDDQIDGFHYYLSYIKFGIGRATSDAAHEIRDGRITRDEGVALVKKYDHEFPARYYDAFLEYCDITDEQVRSILDSWRSDHIWKINNGDWVLRSPIWEE